MVRGNSSVLPSLLHMAIIVASCVTQLSSLIVPIQPHTGKPSSRLLHADSDSLVMASFSAPLSPTISTATTIGQLNFVLENEEKKTGCGNTFVVHCL